MGLGSTDTRKQGWKEEWKQEESRHLPLVFCADMSGWTKGGLRWGLLTRSQFQLSASVVPLHVGDDISLRGHTLCEIRLDDGRLLWLQWRVETHACVFVCESHVGRRPSTLSAASHYCQDSGLAVRERVDFPGSEEASQDARSRADKDVLRCLCDTLHFVCPRVLFTHPLFD